MTYYLIKLFEDNISVYECLDNEQRVLKNMGEESQPYKHDDFWNWWKKKVEYQGESCVFIIITDKDEFDVPQGIQIADVTNIASLYSPLLHNIPSNTNIITKPDNISLENKPQKQTKTKVKKVPRNDKSLEDYFVKETVRLRSC